MYKPSWSDKALIYASRLLLPVIILLIIVSCASQEAETPKQRAFAAVADYTAFQSVARAYVSRPDANPRATALIIDVVSDAWPVALVLRGMAEGDTLTFCGVGDVLPDGLGADVAVLACVGDLKSVTGKTMAFTAALRLIITEMGDSS